MGIRRRVLLADDHDVIRMAFQQLLESYGGFEVVGQARDGFDALAQAEKTLPDLVVMDVCMPLMNGIEATRKIKKVLPYAKIIVVSFSNQRQHVLASLDAGASGYVLKTEITVELLPAVKTVLRGETYMSSPVAKYIADQDRGADRIYSHTGSSELSARERQVLQLIAEGKSSKQIGYVLGVEESTVVVHRRNIMSKLNMHSIAELTRHAIQCGITPLEFIQV